MADSAAIRPVGTFVQIYGVDESTDGSAKVLVQGIRRYVDSTIIFSPRFYFCLAVLIDSFCELC